LNCHHFDFFSLEDSLPETQSRCRELWSNVGDDFIEKSIKNDEKLKEKMDMVVELGQPKHFPAYGSFLVHCLLSERV
jgi:hypothetical protein